MIQDLLLENNEVFMTEQLIAETDSIKSLLYGTTPDFVIKKGNGRQKTLIMDIHVGEKDFANDLIKETYRKLEFFADFKIITPYNFGKELKMISPETMWMIFTGIIKLFGRVLLLEGMYEIQEDSSSSRKREQL